jgi:glycyl-tRNA synthetase
MDSSDILSLCKRRGFFWPSFEIYGGVAGMYDYGPLGTELKNNITNVWRDAYRLGEGFVEIDSETINPEPVFKASGHLDEFSDLLVTCKGCAEPFRADHLVKGLHPNPDCLSRNELETLIRENDVRCPDCGGELASVEEFNLMFKTNIGPGSNRPGYLRPETAQGIFVNFTHLYRYMREKLPFGVIQVGRGYRNEISPRQGVIRLREFNMMEAELFVDPEDKSWERYDGIKDELLHLVPSSGEEIRVTVAQAVERGIIANEVLAYFVWFTQDFLSRVGVDPERMRFRQHLTDEMAHYAADCWDAEALLSYGWTEIVGIADRGCWDLSMHASHSGADLSHFIRFDEPKEIEREAVKARFKALGPRFKGKARAIADALETKTPKDIVDGRIVIELDGERIEVDQELFEVQMVREKVAGTKVIPHVIEPSHGLDRILYTCLEHSYSEKEEGYVTLRLRPLVAPIKVGVFPLMARDGLDVAAKAIAEDLRRVGIATLYDESGSIGRRYARMDEVGTPWCITVDYQTFEEEARTVTIRDRDTAEQVRVPVSEVQEAVRSLLKGAELSGLGQKVN